MAITLNEIAYNILNLAYGGKNSEENNISLRQIKHWVHYHRAKLIADKLDKGILDNSILWQRYPLSAFSSFSSTLMKYNEDWQNYLDHGGTAPDPASTSTYGANGVKLLENMPRRTSGDLDGSWVISTSITADSSGSTQMWQDADKRNQYGVEITKSQLRGDYRNIGNAKFIIPEILMLNNDNSFLDKEKMV